MYWVLYIVARGVRERVNSTCSQLRIPSMCMPFGGGGIFLSPEGSGVAEILTLEDAIITPLFNSVFLLIAWSHHIGDRVKFII